MEPIIILGLLIILAAAAPRWGRDSRVGVRSKEHDLAVAGVCWAAAPSRERRSAPDPAHPRPRGRWRAAA